MWPYLGRFSSLNELCERLADDRSEFYLAGRPVACILLFAPPGCDRGPLHPLRELLRLGGLFEPVLGHSQGDEEVIPVQPDPHHRRDPHLHPAYDAARGRRHPT